jgi:Transposase zinc-binding domain/Putative transposase
LPWLHALASRAQHAGTVSRSRHAPHRFERHPGAAAAPLPRGYRPRRPEATALYRVVADPVETMLEQARERSAHGFGLPRHVERTFHRYLACGILAHGFARVTCTSCRDEILVPFSCKTRGLCPSCDGRRMADTAAHLCDRVLPDASYRQWTLSFPRGLRFRLLRDRPLVSEVLRAFVRAVFAYQRRRARALGVADGQLGAVTAVQRFGSFVNANLHFHTLIPDGVWQEDPGGTVRFHPLSPPTDDDVEALAARIVRRTARILGRRDADLPGDDEPDALGCAQAESVQTALPLAEPEREPARARRRLCGLVDGFSLHAGTFVDAADRAALERLARYLLRPAISANRVAVRPDGRVEYRFRRPDPAGRTSWVTDGPTLCRRLATLIPTTSS